MNRTLLKLLTLALITLVALPPGWCGACCRPATKAVAAKSSCCQHTQSSSSSSSHGCSLPTPSVGCCCTQPVIVPQTVVLDDDHLVVLPAPAVIDSARLESNFAAVELAQFVPPPGGLSLHILQCVWRC